MVGVFRLLVPAGMLVVIGMLSLPTQGKTPFQDQDSKQKLIDYLFESGTEGYQCFRIPAMVTTKAGTLLAFAEGRKKGCSDTGDIDLVLKRSEDNGKTWNLGKDHEGEISYQQFF